MNDSEANTVLGRKAAAARQERKARAMTLQKALRLSMAKVADSLMDLPVAVIGAVVQPIEGDAVEAALEDDSLLLLMDGPARCIGGVTIEAGVVGALIQQQTIGSVLPDKGDSRAMTPTDAAICAPLIDALLVRSARIVEDDNDRALIEGFTFGAKAEDPRALALALDASEYVSIRLTLDIARGNRQGVITLFFPTLAAREVTFDDDLDEVEDVATEPKVDLTSMVMGVNADLDMVVCQLQVPLNALRAWKIGDVLQMTPGTFPSVQITTQLGRVLGRGLVGHVDGQRAVMPTRPPKHASEPLRRESDLPNVDMPEIQVLTSTGRRSTVPRELDVSESDVEEAMRALSLKLDGQSDAPIALPDFTSDDSAGLPELNDLPAVDNLPELDDLPDLNDLPNLDDLPDLAAAPDTDGLPDLDDLPNLEDMPDLADLPDLPMLSAG